MRNSDFLRASVASTVEAADLSLGSKAAMKEIQAASRAQMDSLLTASREQFGFVLQETRKAMSAAVTVDAADLLPAASVAAEKALFDGITRVASLTTGGQFRRWLESLQAHPDYRLFEARLLEPMARITLREGVPMMGVLPRVNQTRFDKHRGTPVLFAHSGITKHPSSWRWEEQTRRRG